MNLISRMTNFCTGEKMKASFDKKFLLFIVVIDGFMPVTKAAVITINSESSPSRVRDEIEDSFSSYLESHSIEEQPFRDTVDIVLAASGYQYEIISNKIPAVDAYRTIYI